MSCLPQAPSRSGSCTRCCQQLKFARCSRVERYRVLSGLTEQAKVYHWKPPRGIEKDTVFWESQKRKDILLNTPAASRATASVHAYDVLHRSTFLVDCAVQGVWALHNKGVVVPSWPCHGQWLTGTRSSSQVQHTFWLLNAQHLVQASPPQTVAAWGVHQNSKGVSFCSPCRKSLSAECRFLAHTERNSRCNYHCFKSRCIPQGPHEVHKASWGEAVLG